MSASSETDLPHHPVGGDEDIPLALRQVSPLCRHLKRMVLCAFHLPVPRRLIHSQC